VAHYHFERLTFLDNASLLIESPTTPMHVAAISTFEMGPLERPDGGLDIDRIREFVASKLHRIPRYRQKLAWVPLEQQPVWVDDHHFNIHYHVRHTALPRPGDERQLKRLAARVMAQHLDRSKPLWELWFVEGLEHADRFAMIQKFHHCMVDGAAAVALMDVLLDHRPTTDFPPAPRWVPRPEPTAWELAADAVGRYLRLPAEIAGLAPGLLDGASALRERVRALADTARSTTALPDATPINQRIGPHRRFDWLSMDLAAIKAVKGRLGGTVNDVLLATVAGAMRRFLERRGVRTEGLDFRVMAPVNVRSASERTAPGNRVSAWMVPLPIAEPDPVKQVEAVRAATRALKDSHQALGADTLMQLLDHVPAPLLAFAVPQVAHRLLAANLVVTNVPGSREPLYLLGAKMLDTYGFIPLSDYLCLNIVLFSYVDALHWGFVGEWDLVPDLHDFVDDVRVAFQQLVDAVALQPDGAASRTRAP